MAQVEDARRGVGPTRRTGLGVMPRIRRRLFQGLVAFAVVAAGTWFGVVEVRQRFTHVHETDARVVGDLVTVSSRVAGRLIEFAVEPGDRVIRAQVVARLDARVESLLLDQLEARLDAARAGRERLAAERTLIDERARLDVLDREIDALGHREAELRSRIEQQRIDVADRTIRSPIGGVVDRVFARAGEYVRPGQRLAIVHDPKRVWIEANVKETQIRKLAAGQPVEVRVDAYPGKVLRGRVRSIGSATTGSFALLPSPNPSGNFTKITQRIPVRIDVERSGERLAPGMMVEVRIDVRG